MAKFVKGQTPWNKGKKCIQFTESNNSQWKGDAVGYHPLHQWVTRHLGKPTNCERCGRENVPARDGRSTIQWANISKQYKRETTDWERLCVSCHKKEYFVHGETWNKGMSKYSINLLKPKIREIYA